MIFLCHLKFQIFGTPRHHPKSQPFVDHVFSFSIKDNRIWFRNYQILEENAELAEIGKFPEWQWKKYLMVLRIHVFVLLANCVNFSCKWNAFCAFSGPRMVLNPIRIFQGSFGGPTLYLNDHYVSPNEVSSRKYECKWMIQT